MEFRLPKELIDRNPHPKYRVIVENARLSVIVGGTWYSVTTTSKDVPLGAILEGGHGGRDYDGITVPYFKDEDGDIGTFWPNDFGNVSRYLELIEE